MHRRSRTAISLAVVLGLCLALPGVAAAGKKNKRKARKAAAAATVDGDTGHPGRGLGKGGVPALRDELVYTIHRVDELEEAVGDLQDEVGDGMEMLAGLIGALQDDLTALEDRVAALEELARDDDEDGFSENLGDCDDADPLVNPLAEEVLDNGVDDDCDFEVDEVPPMPEPEPEPGV